MHQKYLTIFCLILLLSSCSTQKNVHINNNSPQITHWIKPPNLKTGDSIAIITPASFLKDSISSIQNGLDTITSWGLNYKIYDHAFDKQGHFAGSDKDRASDFQKAIDNPNMKAIWCARGGYGSVRIIDDINFNNLSQNPKWLIGYSDITVIHNMMQTKGLESIHGIVLTSFNNTTSETLKANKSLKNILFGIDNKYEIESSPYNKTGTASGILVGGNLSLLYSQLGSNSSLANMDNKILFIEDK